MIPYNLRDQWELVKARAEVLFLADHGGGFPDCLAGDNLTPTERRVTLHRLGFRVSDEYDMPDPKDWNSPVKCPWVRLTNNVAVCLMDGFVNRACAGRRRHK